jgi:amino acid transporter
LAVVAQDSDLGMAAILLIVATAFSVLVILPAAVVANFIALRVFRPRSWRREPWRAYVAGILAVPFCWGGSYLWLILDVDAPPIVRELGEWGKVILVAGMVILFSNLALLVAWLLPSRKRPATPGGE